VIASAKVRFCFKYANVSTTFLRI